ncbi:MAG: ATP-binding protein [Gemmataceae bacterium]|nr:ATP-binding protein [Gemmataceae bacterium]
MAADPFSDDVTIRGELAEAHALQARIEAALTACGYTDHGVFFAKLAMEEALVDAIKDGNGMDPDQPVRVRSTITPAGYDIRVTDAGGRTRRIAGDRGRTP